jgi:HK97 family phage prohead protease
MKETLEIKKDLTFDVEVKSVDENEFTVDAVFSSKVKDRQGDILPPDVLLSGAENYLKNPVLLDSHTYHSVKNIIGSVEDLKASGSAVSGRVKYFVGQGNDAADWAFALAKNKIASFSVGFRALDYEYIKEKNKEGYEIVTGYQFKKVELLEISQVSVPANPKALMKSFEAVNKPAAQVPVAEPEKQLKKEDVKKAFTDALTEIKKEQLK